jgi:hypothetical protein
MSGGLTTATRRQKKSSNLAASPSNSGKNEIRIGCPTLMTIYLSGISEAGRNIAEHSERAEAASTAESTALPSGIGEIRRALPLHALSRPCFAYRLQWDLHPSPTPSLTAIVHLVWKRAK